MNIIKIGIFIGIVIYFFIAKSEYILATILVGQPIIKLFLKPFPVGINDSTWIIIYFLIGFYAVLIIKLYKKNNIFIDVPINIYSISYLCFCILILISLIYTPDKKYGLEKAVEFISVSMLIIITSNFAIKKDKDFTESMKAIGNIAILIGLITVIIIYIKTGSIFVRLGTSKAQEIEVLGINFAVSIWFGRRMGLGLISLLFYDFINPSIINKSKLIFLGILIILSGSRGPILAVSFTLIIISIINILNSKLDTKKYKKIIKVTIFIMICIGVITLINDTSKLKRLFITDDGNIISRFSLYNSSIYRISQNILGYGIGSFSFITNSIHRYPHNLILEIFLELGVQGLVIFIVILGYSFNRYLFFLRNSYNKKNIYYLNYSFSILIFAFINAMFSGNIISNEYVWFSFVLMFISLGNFKE